MLKAYPLILENTLFVSHCIAGIYPLKDKKITRQAIADAAGVSKKTIERYIKEIDNLKYVGRGSNGHWEIKGESNLW